MTLGLVHFCHSFSAFSDLINMPVSLIIHFCTRIKRQAHELLKTPYIHMREHTLPLSHLHTYTHTHTRTRLHPQGRYGPLPGELLVYVVGLHIIKPPI